MKNWLLKLLVLVTMLGLSVSFVEAQGPPSAFPYSKAYQNDSGTGTTQFTLTKLNSSGNAVKMGTSDLSGYIGVCVANCGTTGTAWVAFAGLVPLTMDAASTINDYVTVSATTAGNGKDTGATTYPKTGAVIGRVQTATGGAGVGITDLFSADIVAQSGVSDITPNLYVAGGGTAQAQTATLSPAAKALTAGLYFCWKPAAANTAAAPTMAVNGLTATAITKLGTTALVANDITTAAIACVIYDGTQFQLQNPQTVSAGGTSRWDQITNPTGNLTLTMGSNLTEFDYTTALANAWKLAVNTTVATVTTPQSSPVVNLACGTDWTGAGASTQGCATVQYTPVAGLNAASQVTYDITDSSSSTNVGFTFNKKLYTVSTGSFNIGAQGSRLAAYDQSGFEAGPGSRGLFFANTSNIDAGGIDTGITRLGAGLLAASNGSANNSSGLFHSGSNVFVTSNFTTAANTSLQTITGLSWALPSTTNAFSASFTCHLTYSQATATAAVAFGIQAATAAPTNIYAQGTQQISTTTPFFAAPATLATLTTTTATNIVSGTPGATGTNYIVLLSGTVENPATTANTINIMVSTATSGDAVTVLRGSYCTMF